MPDSQLNGPERALQPSFRKAYLFNGLLVALGVALAFWLIRALPDRRPMPPVRIPITYTGVALQPANGPLRLRGAWELQAADRRVGGLSALAIDGNEFLAVSDLGAVVRFPKPGTVHPQVRIQDLREGPGRFGKKWGRDAESLAPDPSNRGWWVGFEQRHSVWLYDRSFAHAIGQVDLKATKWPDNRGAEALLVRNGHLLVLGENGRGAVLVRKGELLPRPLHANAAVAEAARGPDGSAWVVLRENGLLGIRQWIAPLLETHDGYRLGPRWALPKASFDNLEGLAIEATQSGWRFWLISDDGHRFMARTLLVALEIEMRARHDKSPAPGTGLSNKPADEAR